MSSVIISGDTSGAITVSAPLVAGTNTLTLQAATATNSVNTLGTAVASTSGTSIDFTGLPSWIKKITVMLAGVSTNGTSNLQIQLGAGSVTTTGYISSASVIATAVASTTSTSGLLLEGGSSHSAAETFSGSATITLLTSNTWVMQSVLGRNAALTVLGGGSIALGGTLDRVRLTTANGTDTFDLGSVNILYEG
jgi:hypothetical protein